MAALMRQATALRTLLSSFVVLLSLTAVGCIDDGTADLYHEFGEDYGGSGEGGILVRHSHNLSTWKGTHLRLTTTLRQRSNEGGAIYVPLLSLERCMNVFRAAGGNEVVCDTWLLSTEDLYDGASSALRVPYNEGDDIVDTTVTATWYDIETEQTLSQSCRYHDWGNKNESNCDAPGP